MQGKREAVAAATRNNDVATVRGLLSDGQGVLEYAIEEELHETVVLLVAHGENLNKAPFGMNGGSALHLSIDGEADVAAQLGANEVTDVRMTRLLLDLGADPMIKDRNGRTSLDFARWWGHDAAVTLIEERLKSD